MDETELIRRELRAAREELVRKRTGCAEDQEPAASALPLMPDRDDEFLRLALMTAAELEAHIERLERDLKDLNDGIAELEEGQDTP